MKFLLQPEAFIHQPLQSRPIENIVSKFFVGKHAQRGATGIRGHLRRLFQRQIGILAYHRHHHAHHDLQAPQSSRLVHVLIVFAAWLFGALDFHTAPVFFGFILWIWMLAAFPVLLQSPAPIAIVAPFARESSCPWPYTFVTTRQRYSDCRNLLTASSMEDACQSR